MDEAEVQAFYEENKEARFRLPPGQIRASHILIELPADATPDQEAATLQEAEEALARVQSGEDFVAVARELSDDQATASRGGDLGYFGRGVKPPPFEAAAFGMAVEEVSDVVRTDLGYHIIKKTGEAGASYKSLTEVRPEILEELYDRRTQIELEKTTLTAYDALKQGTPLDAVAEEAGLPVQQTDLLAEGEAFGGLSPDAAEYQQLFRIAGQEAGEPIAVPRGRLLAVAAEVRGAAPVPFDEALEEVRAAYRTDRAAEYARTRAEAIREAAAGGQSLAAAGEGLALTPTTSASISRDDPLAPDLTDEPELIELIFAQEAEAVAGPVETAQGLVVFQVVEKKPVDWDQFPDRKEGIVETLRSRRTNDRYFSLLQHLRESRSWRVNEAFIQQVNRRYQEQDQDQSQTAAG